MSVVQKAHASVVAENHTMIIKKSCAWRAKYEEDASTRITPLQIVPHPLNRAGDTVKVRRCRNLTCDIARDGFDVIEAEQNAVVIQQPPNAEAVDIIAKANVCNPDYDAHFAEGVLDSNDMCVRYGTPIEGGSVSHSHLNVTLRNVQTKRVGCECNRTPVVTGGVQVDCTCGNACICDDTGSYSMG